MLANSTKSVLLSLFMVTQAVFLSTPAQASDSSLFSLESGLNNLIYNVSRSVVTVEAVKLADLGSLIDLGRTKTVVSSGLLVDTAGNVLVSANMIAEFDRYYVVFENRRIPATLVGIDYFNEVALLHIPINIGILVEFSKAQSCAGKMVIALANSHGVRATPSLGFCAGARQDGSMQFTMPLTSGAAGGGIFDLNGSLVGMISGTIGGNDRVVVALPSYRLPVIIDYLISHGDRQSGFIGVTTTDIEFSPAVNLNFDNSLISSRSPSPASISQGTMISSVQPGSPADRAGLLPGDVLYAVEKDPVGSSIELSTFVRLHNPGKVLNFDIIRSGNNLSIPVRVGSKRLSSSLGRKFEAEDTAVAFSADSLSRVVQFLLSEMSRLENQITRRR